MKTSQIFLAVILMAAPISHAQIVADGATNTLSNVTTNFTGDVIVGTNGSFTLLILSDNALLTNSVNGIIGRNATAKSNEVQVFGPTARWRMGGSFFVGSNGAMSRLVITNGAFVESPSVSTLAETAASSNNTVLVTGSGSVWSNSVLIVGSRGPGNQVRIEAGGLMYSDYGTVGSLAAGTNNEVLVTGPGSLWTNRFDLQVGGQRPFNRLIVSNGAAVRSDTAAVSGTGASFSNQVVVTGAGSVWSNQTALYIGFSNRVEVSDGGWLTGGHGSVGRSSTVVLRDNGSGWNTLANFIVGENGNGNLLIVSNGATVLSSNTIIGSFSSVANSNLAIITGAGTLWSNRNDFIVGEFSIGNRLIVSNGATVLSSNLFVGFNSSATNNRVTVDGGTLRMTNASGTSVLDVRRGSNVFNAGVIEVDRLLVTNNPGRFVFNGGTLSTRSTIVNNGQTLLVGNGTSAAMFNLAGNGTHSFSAQLFVAANATLTGNGNISGVLVLAGGGTLAPGASIGRISLSLPPSLLGTTIMEISKNGASLTNDQIQVAGTLVYGGSLTVSNVGASMLTAGDRFQLFPAGSYAGSFSSITLPPLPFPLLWATNLLVDGSIEVESLAPSVTTLPATGLSQTAATLNGVANPKGMDTSAWFEFGFTTNYGNVTPPQPLGNGNGDTNFGEAIAGLIPGVGYHFRAVASNSVGVAFGGDQSVRRLAQHAYLKASNTGEDDRFGTAVAMDGDTLVISAPFEASNATGVNGNQNNNSAIFAGAAYVFVRNGNSWVQQAYLKASNTGSGDDFGTSVAISGDTVVVGARSEASNATGVNGDQSNNSASSSGAAYVFVRSGTNWSQQAYLKASNSGVSDFFGFSVTVSSDTIVVGSPNEDSNATGVNGDGSNNAGTNSGAAYVFVRSGTNWTQQAYLKASNTDTNDQFGFSVSASGDTIIVGANQEDSNATGVDGDGGNNNAQNSGAAYVFVRSGATWTQQAYLKASNTGSGDAFGGDVAITGDTVVVGASLEDSNATGVDGDGSNDSAQNSGAAYVFVRSGTTWTQQAYLKASNTEASDNFVFSDFFGTSVALSGDTVVVGATGEDGNATGVNGNGSNNSGTNSGAAYVFVRSGTTWSFPDYLKASNAGGAPPPASGDNFGSSVAVSGEIVVVGAILESSNATGVNGDQNNNNADDSGAAYVFGPPLPPIAEINVLQSGTNIFNGGSSQQYAAVPTNSQTLGFTIRNTGNGELALLTITIDGPSAPLFSVITTPVAPVAPTSNTIFTVRFAPTIPGTNTATLHIASNDEDENPFDIQLTGLALSFTEDRDSDGLNDASELLMASFGFNFQVSQTSLVNTLFNNAQGAGLFTPSQLQALSLNSPLLAKDPFTGFFTLTIGVEKATELTNFFPYPMTAPQTIINAEGKLEFQFSAPDNAGFFRLEAR